MKDLSNKTVFVLVILTLVISAFSTLLLVSNLNQIPSNTISQSNVNNAQLSYSIRNPPKIRDDTSATIGYKIIDDNEVIN